MSDDVPEVIRAKAPSLDSLALCILYVFDVLAGPVGPQSPPICPVKVLYHRQPRTVSHVTRYCAVSWPPIYAKKRVSSLLTELSPIVVPWVKPAPQVERSLSAVTLLSVKSNRLMTSSCALV